MCHQQRYSCDFYSSSLNCISCEGSMTPAPRTARYGQSMDSEPLDIAFVVMHTSPLHQPGTKDAGGMNVVVRAQAEELARAGHRVRLITRRTATEQAADHELAPGLTVHHLTAGPARLLAKGEHESLI